MVTEPTSGFGRIDSELEDIRQKVEMVTNQAAQHYENIEGIVDDYGKKAIVTPVTSPDLRRLVGSLRWDRRVGVLRTP